MVQITEQFLSLIALNYNHKHENELIKGDDRAVGLTDNPTAPKLTKPCDKPLYEHRESMRGCSVMHAF